MIRTEFLILTLGALLIGGCERSTAPGKPDGAGEKEAVSGRGAAASPATPVAAPPSGLAGEAAAPKGDLASTVLNKEDITVGGQPACALTVRYGEGVEQPVTWRGESCAKILVRLVSIKDLQKIGQDAKLLGEAREDLARLPGGRAVYVEGTYSSAVYLANVTNRVYKLPLAD